MGIGYSQIVSQLEHAKMRHISKTFLMSLCELGKGRSAKDKDKEPSNMQSAEQNSIQPEAPRY